MGVNPWSKMWKYISYEVVEFLLLKFNPYQGWALRTSEYRGLTPPVIEIWPLRGNSFFSII